MDSLMRADNCKILSAKHDLMTSLGDDWDRYLNYLKNWFRGKLTKQEFDRQTRFFLTKQQIFYHNKFILEILNKVECVDPSAIPQVSTTVKTSSVKEDHDVSTHSSKKRKKTTQFVFEQQAFHPYSPADFVKEVDAFKDPKMIYNNTNVPTLRYAAQELFLPEHSLVLGRFLIGAWEQGLMNVEDVAIEMVVQAVQVVLKNILSSCIRRRKHYKVTSNFYYDIGATLRDPTIRNTISRQKADDDTLELSSKELFSTYSTRKFNDDSLFLAACEDSTPQDSRRRINLREIYNTLMDKNVILSHTVHSIAIEKIVAMMN